jgi:hypothetical protein
MKKIILVAIAVACLPTLALADARKPANKSAPRPIVLGAGANPVLLNANASINGNVSSSDREMHFRNLRDSGYDKKADFDAFGNISVAQ